MQHVLQLTQQLADIENLTQLGDFFRELAHKLQYPSCCLQWREPPLLAEAEATLGICSDKLAKYVRLLDPPVWQTLPQSMLTCWPYHDYPQLLAARLRQPQVAAVFVETTGQLSREQQQALSLFWQLLLPQFELLLLKLQQRQLNLTLRELQCVQWAAANKTSWEISRILGISERTVNFHIQNCLQKLAVCNRNQLVQRCRELGLVSS